MGDTLAPKGFSAHSSGKHGAQVYFPSPDADASAAGDRDGPIVQGIFEFAQAGKGGLSLHANG
jgi:hypothetical protein